MIYLSQRDLLWGMVKLGASSLTMAKFGCTTCCLSMISDYFGCYVPPTTISANVNNYTKDGLILWNNLRFGKMNFVNRVRYPQPIFRANVSTIKRAMKDRDLAVMLEVNNGAHWIVALRPAFIGSDILCLDPWTGAKCWAIKEYKNITGAAFFKRV